MRWNLIGKLFYDDPSCEPSSDHSVLLRSHLQGYTTGDYCRDSESGAGLMPEYRDFVEQIAASDARPSQVILNRSPEHAAVVLEALFRHAREHVHIVSQRLSIDVYCAPGVPESAAHFLRTHRNGRIRLLVENHINRETHPFMVAVDNEAADRVDLAVIPAQKREQYAYNFAIADGESYRFEENRDLREAMIRFRDTGFGAKLESAFRSLAGFSGLTLPINS